MTTMTRNFSGMTPTAMLHEANIILAKVICDNPQYRDRLSGVKILWSNRMTVSAGYAERTFNRRTLVEKRTIKLSWPIFKLEENRHDFRDTVLHEIAHHMAGMKAKHGHAWQLVAKMIGCDGNQFHYLKVTLRDKKPRVEVRCTHCGANFMVGPTQANRLNKYTHTKCGGKLERR